MLQAMDIDGVRARQIADDIDNQVTGLSDLLAAMAEVYEGQNDVTGTDSSHLPNSAVNAGSSR